MKLTTVIILGCFCAIFASENEIFDYSGYKVYQIFPTTVEEVKSLLQFRDDPMYDFWSEPKSLNVSTNIMVAPEVQTGFERYLTETKLNFKVLIEDVEVTVQNENVRQKAFSTRASSARAGVSFERFMRIAEIIEYLESLPTTYPENVKLLELGYSFNGLPIKGVRISSGNFDKPTIFIDAGIHAREWITSPTALYVIQQLLENTTNADLLERVDWIVVPNINPDGYEYTHTNARLWRKTRSPHTICAGVDANRNFGYHWMENGASSWQCSETYAGPSAFSEVEARAVRDFLLANKDDIKLYINLHSYGNYLLYPWSYAAVLADDNEELFTLATEVDKAMTAAGSDPYEIGTPPNVLYEAAGGSIDWVKGVAGIELSYTIELPGGGDEGFNPPATMILPVVQQTWEGFRVFGQYIDAKFGGN